ncbi:hypothetical protein AJ80_03548 [Polytolypa hystricis UAMH7299]|uniref:Uncharacterized protein n=1 Tax=Polytolypa hystricis (strain UAMH7299) TaxID=1447883 RepID=A0A2B7YHA7_POLH7|nr:hypothetical protein AJ80_03548 [Polytolypa hystricis UAMH7299]
MAASSVHTTGDHPVGSGIFTVFALSTIFSLILLLLRRYLPLRTTPAYLFTPVFLALALPASVILLVPIDLTSSSRKDESGAGIWLPDRAMLVAWRIAYWLTFVLTWVILPLLGEYIDSGYRTPKARLLYSLRSNGRYQLIVLSCGVAGLIYIIVQNGLDFTSLKGLVMALAYFWGLALAIYVMGHGLVAIPRKLIRNANIGGRLRRIYTRAPQVHDRLTDAFTNLEKLESEVSQLQKKKVGLPMDLHEWIDSLAYMTSIPESRTLDPAGNQSRPTVPSVITERYLADLTRRLVRARHQNARFADTWKRLVQEASDVQAIQDSSASKRLEFGPTHKSAIVLVPLSSMLTPYTRYHLHVHILPATRLVFAAIFSLASVCIIWSEIIKSFAPRLSIISLTVVHTAKDGGNVGFWGQVVASAWILYMCSAALTGINDAKIWGNRALVPRNTYGESACWYAGQIAKLTIPLSYNFLTFLPRDMQYDTTFYKFLGRLINLTPLGKGFDYFFPIFVLIPVCATLFNLYGKAQNLVGLSLLEEDDDDIGENPSGYGTGGWREGRGLIERELNGPGSLGLSSTFGAGRISPQGRPSSARSDPVIWVPPGRSGVSRPERPQRNNAPVPLSEEEGEEEEENPFQSFVHRVKNTFDTANKPRWLRLDESSVRRPRWMGGDGGEDGPEESDGGAGSSSGLGRWFGGRPAQGKIRL